MSFSLYAATVPSYQQILGAVSGLLDKAEAFCTAKSLAPPQIIQARLAPDMLPFAYQVKSTVVHSIGSIEGVRRGVLPRHDPAAGILRRAQGNGEALTALAEIQPAEMSTASWAGTCVSASASATSIPLETGTRACQCAGVGLLGGPDACGWFQAMGRQEQPAIHL